ncbi:MAG: undecaprenyldiphospho-muramoylpentapeptide beta-N-acetylglucosaminyltransferase [Syntrophales bacterium]|nr:undecaprenyldiphospho-muramoylpentapeptide beta-N-acetylglucosaminyltransferase [Syntrophales bacterium]
MRIIIAGGGTGGHLFPGIAIAEAFMKRDPGNEVLFIGTERGIEKRVIPEMGYPLRLLDVEGIKGRGLAKAASALLKIPNSMMQSFRILRDYSPQVVIGVGGYASAPAVLAAALMGIPTAIAEQNALPGVTNRILGRFVKRIFLSFPDAEGWFPPRKAVVTGNPVRDSFREAVRTEEEKKAGGPFTLLIFGGSQGAHVINMAVVEALDLLADVKDGMEIIHQTGQKDYETVAAAYRKAGFKADVRPFIMDMSTCYRRADLLVCRAGATSVAEITATGKASILIPFARAVADHQTKNAEFLVNACAAAMIAESALTGKTLAQKIRNLQHRPDEIRRMEDNAVKLGNWRAADDIVDAAIALLH